MRESRAKLRFTCACGSEANGHIVAGQLYMPQSWWSITVTHSGAPALIEIGCSKACIQKALNAPDLAVVAQDGSALWPGAN